MQLAEFAKVCCSLTVHPPIASGDYSNSGANFL
jgi:hypothetical protein